jgi:hypothetical protein
MGILVNFFELALNQVRAINRKYAQPQIHMTAFVKVCLVSLRLYLVVLIGLMVFKFVMAVKH